MPHPPTVGNRPVPAEAQRRLVELAAAGNPGPPARVVGAAAAVVADGAVVAVGVSAAEASAAAGAVSEDEGRSGPAPAPIHP
jgi:hypothetical protein